MEQQQINYDTMTREQLISELEFQQNLIHNLSMSNGQLNTALVSQTMRVKTYEKYISELPKEKPEEE